MNEKETTIEEWVGPEVMKRVEAEAKSYAERAADFDNLHNCNRLERLLHAGQGRQVRRQFERLFGKLYPRGLRPTDAHPRLKIVIRHYEERVAK